MADISGCPLCAISRQKRLDFVARPIQNRSELKMCGAEVDFLRLPRGRTISRTVVGGAQERTALDHAAR